MQPVLPSTLDRVSAQVLGFDANAYLNSTPSTLHQRLNIPGSMGFGDAYVSNKNVNKNKEKKVFWGLTLGGTALAAAAFIFCKIKGIKLGSKLPKAEGLTTKLTNLKNKLFKNKKTAPKPDTGAKNKASIFLANTRTKISSWAESIMKKFKK